MRHLILILALSCAAGLEQITCDRGTACRTPCLVEPGALTAWGSDPVECGPDPNVQCKFQFLDVVTDRYQSVAPDCTSECVENP